MRVLRRLRLRWGDRRDDRTPGEDGAVLIVVTFAMLALLLIAAFVIDLGLAYTGRRQVQTAADAAAVAAAESYATVPGSCFDMRDGQLDNDAITRGRQLTAENLGVDVTDVLVSDSEGVETADGQVLVDAAIRCGGEGHLEVSWEIQASTQAGLGAAGGIREIEYGAVATAQVRVTGTILPNDANADPPAGRVLPYMICSNDLGLPTAPDLSSRKVVKIQWRGDLDESDDCPTEEATTAGNFWAVRCPEENGSYQLSAKTLTGCEGPVSVVQPQMGDPNSTPRDQLVAGCGTPPERDEDCLQGTSGLLDGSEDGLPENWTAVLGETVYFPVFCGDAACDPAAFINASGDRTEVYYPVQHIAGAIVCGYDWGDEADAWGQSTDPACADNPYDPPGPSEPAQDYVLLRLVHARTAGGLPVRDCGLGSSCDIGPRQVILAE